MVFLVSSTAYGTKSYGEAKLKFFNNSSITSYVNPQGCDVESESTCSLDGSLYTCDTGEYLYIHKGSGCGTSVISCGITIYSNASGDEAYELGYYQVNSQWDFTAVSGSQAALTANNLSINANQSNGNTSCVVDLNYPVYKITLEGG